MRASPGLLCLFASLSAALPFFSQPAANASAFNIDFSSHAVNGTSAAYWVNVSGSPAHFHVFGDCDKATVSHQAKENACILAMNGGPFGTGFFGVLEIGV